MRISDRRAFTIAEAVTAVVVAMYVMLAAWSVYVMAWKWWSETAPIIDAQRAARISLDAIVNGMGDLTAGQDAVSGNTYRRRSGIAFSTLTNANPAPATPVISGGSARIDFRLEPDINNVRAYYIGIDGATGKKALYYQDSLATVRKIHGTDIDPATGDISISFTAVAGYNNLYKVTVAVERQIYGVRNDPYEIAVQYEDFVFMRNI